MFLRLMEEARGNRLGWIGPLSARLVLIGAIGMLAARRTEASPYYTVTDIGGFDRNGPNLADYGFTNTVRGSGQMTDAEWANLPTYDAVVSGPSGPYAPQIVTMKPTAINDSGTIIGSLATNVYRDGVAITSNLGYAVRSPDGQYSPFVSLATNPEGYYTQVYLSQANQVLIVPESSQLADNGQGARLVDLNTGTTTPMVQLIPPDLLQKLTSVNFDGINDRGDLLIDIVLGSKGREYYILTPPGVDPPPVPEPSTLLIFAAAGALAVRAARRRNIA